MGECLGPFYLVKRSKKAFLNDTIHADVDDAYQAACAYICKLANPLNLTFGLLAAQVIPICTKRKTSVPHVPLTYSIVA